MRGEICAVDFMRRQGNKQKQNIKERRMTKLTRTRKRKRERGRCHFIKATLLVLFPFFPTCVHVVVEIYFVFPFFLSSRIISLSLSLSLQTLSDPIGVQSDVLCTCMYTEREKDPSKTIRFSLFSVLFGGWCYRHDDGQRLVIIREWNLHVESLTMFLLLLFGRVSGITKQQPKKSSTLTARCVKDDRGGTKKRNWRALYGQKRTGGGGRRGHQYVSWFTMTQDSNEKKKEEDYLISYY